MIQLRIRIQAPNVHQVQYHLPKLRFDDCREPQCISILQRDDTVSSFINLQTYSTSPRYRSRHFCQKQESCYFPLYYMYPAWEASKRVPIFDRDWVQACEAIWFPAGRQT